MYYFTPTISYLTTADNLCWESMRHRISNLISRWAPTEGSLAHPEMRNNMSAKLSASSKKDRSSQCQQPTFYFLPNVSKSGLLNVFFFLFTCQIQNISEIHEKKLQPCLLLQELTFIYAVDSRILYCGFII